MNFPPDLIEEQVANRDQAWELLNQKLPQFKKLFNDWKSWYKSVVSNAKVRRVVIDAMLVSYARMALRNGSLSLNPRSYHNETHIDDLLCRLMQLSKTPSSQTIPEYGWSLLSLFMSCHDLRQSEKSNRLELIGNNEQASFQEASRLLIRLDKHKVINKQHKELLQLMIHGSTFGKGEDTKGNIYKGNLVKYLLKKVRHFDLIDKELAFIACDIDTANVASNIKEYAQSSINVYNEIQNISKNPVSAQVFFGEQQELYFFELQKFNSKLGELVFSKRKQINAPKIKQISLKIKQLDGETNNNKVVKTYLSLINSIASQA